MLPTIDYVPLSQPIASPMLPTKTITITLINVLYVLDQLILLKVLVLRDVVCLVVVEGLPSWLVVHFSTFLFLSMLCSRTVECIHPISL